MKKITYRTQKELDGIRWMAKVMDFNMSLMIKTAINELYSSIAILKEQKHKYKQTIKRNANLALSCAKLKETEILSLIALRKFFEDYSDSVIDFSQDDISDLRVAIQQYLKEKDVKDYVFISYMECTRVLLKMCDLEFDNIVNRAKELFGYDYAERYKEFKVTNILHHWTTTCNETYKGYSNDIDMNTQEILIAFKVVHSKFADGLYTKQCQELALKENPNIKENYIIVKEK